MTRHKRFNSGALINLRRSKNLNKKEFAAIVGTHRNNVMNWENGKIKPSMTMFERILNSFKIDDANIFFL